MRRITPSVGALGLALCLAGCVSPARTDEQYHAKAVVAVESAAGEVANVELAVTQRQARKLPGAYADEVVTSSETTLGAIGDAFGSVQPPSPASDGTRDDVGEALGGAQDAVAAARIAVRRDDADALTDALDELDAAGGELETAEAGLR